MFGDPRRDASTMPVSLRARAIVAGAVAAGSWVTLLALAGPAGADGTGQRVVVEIPPHTEPTTHTGVGPAGLLPRTGGAVALWVIAAAITLIVVGAILVLAGRRGRRGSVA